MIKMFSAFYILMVWKGLPPSKPSKFRRFAA
jgi:hypothetical protein